ncbi:hypothetical protein M501DRAFT_280467 [Patellaria atrata CBS 101060]|uniref:RanBD1 domain-containing protein n=1 Tax=Patellaria atrata CBS 101060 TaxID=1346257 RepID=A0A9P4S4S1_9PEZI|nr:hypothetical protein M501DRAFT_280467 [Patellaria atrata CBS 101060]
MSPPTAQRRGSPQATEKRPPDDQPVMEGTTKRAPSTNSDSEGERPVREQMKNTTIAGSQADTSVDNMSEGSDNGVIQATIEVNESQKVESSDRGRLRRKRSIQDIEGEQLEDTPAPKANRHLRKRSRDIQAGETDFDAIRRVTSPHPPPNEAEETSMEDAVEPTINGTGGNRSNTPDKDSSKASSSSPGHKRSREEYLEDEQKDVTPTVDLDTEIKDAINGEYKQAVSPQSISIEKNQPRTKRHRDSYSPQSTIPDVEPLSEVGTETKIPPSSGFANTSSTSPFGALAGSKSPPSQPQTSSTAFAKSGFGALANSTSSPFGSMSPSTGNKSPFGAFGTSTTSKLSSFASPVATDKPSSTTFGGGATAGDKSPFAAAFSTSTLGNGTSGFSGLGASSFGSRLSSGFGTLAGGGLSSFASGGGQITGLSEKPAKPFGAPESDEEEDDEDDTDDEDDEDAQKDEDREDNEAPKTKAIIFDGDEKKDKRKDVETGEENETTVFVSRAKLYTYVKVDGKSDKKEWKERGVGTLKLNKRNASTTVNDDDTEAGPKVEPVKARFVMRADATHNVILNTAVQKDLKVGDPQGGPPKGMYVYFWGSVDGKALELMQFKLKQQNATDLCEKVKELQDQM